MAHHASRIEALQDLCKRIELNRSAECVADGSAEKAAEEAALSPYVSARLPRSSAVGMNPTARAGPLASHRFRLIEKNCDFLERSSSNGPERSYLGTCHLAISSQKRQG
jgi:hypothetical protein